MTYYGVDVWLRYAALRRATGLHMVRLYRDIIIVINLLLINLVIGLAGGLAKL